MQLIVTLSGMIKCLYDEKIDVAAIGTMRVRRASHVEPDEMGSWWADLTPVSGPRLGPFKKRSEALLAEKHWIESWLCEPNAS